MKNQTIDAKLSRMRELISLIQQENEEYFLKDSPRVSDKEYDLQYEELLALEKETNVIFSNSPTQHIGCDILEGLQKVTHTKPMLSADKIHTMEEVIKFVEKAPDGKVVASWKLDGLTLVLRYRNGQLTQAITRGRGQIGEDVTHNIGAVKNVPLSIPFKDDLEVRGECFIPWSKFDAVNQEMGDDYSHPRNLAAGSIRLLNPAEAKERCLQLKCFELVQPETAAIDEMYQFLASLGFDVVEHYITDAQGVSSVMESFDRKTYPNPADGIILEYNDKAFGASLGATTHHENCRVAYKWPDQLYETTFRRVIVKPTRTGRLSLTAEFDPVDMDGASVSHATLHNYDIFERAQLGVGDRLKVYKANMIIPAIAENLTKSGTYALPATCPCCGAAAVIDKQRKTDDARYLLCPNPSCPAKHVRKFQHFCGRDYMNIEGLASASLEAFVDAGLIQSFSDIYHLSEHQAEIEAMEGFGQRSFTKMVDSIEKSKDVSLGCFLASFGIPLVGRHVGKILESEFKTLPALLQALDDHFDFSSIDGIGSQKSNELIQYLRTPQNREEMLKVAALVRIALPASEAADNPFKGKRVVATGSLEKFSRSGIEEKLESLGAKATGSVSKKTDFVIAGPGAGSKLTKAQALGVRILSESEFLEMIGEI